MNASSLWQIFLSFFKIGLFTFGGGYAMMPMLQKELVEKHSWVTPQELADAFAVSQCMPGAIAVNAATFVGHKQRGTPGGIMATLGVVTPSLLIILALSTLIDQFSALPVVTSAFAGIRVAVAALVLASVVKLWKASVQGKLGYLVFGLVFVLSIVPQINLSPILLVLLGLLLGLIVNAIPWHKRGGDAP